MYFYISKIKEHNSMIIKSIINKILISRNPIKYWEKKGLNMGEECEIYSTASFGSEPYLITIHFVHLHARETD